ncbi:MAG: T9SS type A sorting domain-containing protein [Bacteroidales bacterium]|nr:T9SS type A sorting domain-containing protein [Bacteroidales bacterium]
MTREWSIANIAGDLQFRVYNCGGGIMHYTAEVISGLEWLSITSGGKGTNSGNVNFHWERNRYDYKRYGTIRVSSADAEDSPAYISIVQREGPPTFVRNNELDFNFNLFPNPITSVFRIELNESIMLPADIKVFSLNGSLLYEQRISQKTVDINFPIRMSGLCIIQVKDSNNNQRIKKVVVNSR